MKYTVLLLCAISMHVSTYTMEENADAKNKLALQNQFQLILSSCQQIAQMAELKQSIEQSLSRMPPAQKETLTAEYTSLKHTIQKPVEETDQAADYALEKKIERIVAIGKQLEQWKALESKPSKVAEQYSEQFISLQWAELNQLMAKSKELFKKYETSPDKEDAQKGFE